jgi:hypothetical protein
VIADLTADGFAQVAARLWDVAADSSQSLVAQSLYRPRTDNLNPQVFQLNANGWHFAAGHVAKLELLGQSSPYGRASNGTFTVTVSSLELRLPTLESPDGGAIQPPAPAVEPPVDIECGTAPASGCRAPAAHGAKLRIVHGKPRLLWKWTKGAATTVADFGNPLATTSYALCVYPGSQRLMSVTAPAGGTCAGRPCWTVRPKGFRYGDLAYTPTGASRLDLQAGTAGHARIGMQGKGALLAVPTLPVQGLPVTVQLRNSNGACWGSTFGSAQRNDAGQFKATSD